MKSPVLLGFGLCFASLACAQSTNDLPGLIPPYSTLPPTFWEQYGLMVILGGLIGVALVGVLIWLISRPKTVPVLPSEVQARQALEALRAQPETSALLSQVSQILKRYFNAAFGNQRAELTTAEVEHSVIHDRRVKAETGYALVAFLKRCDALKFDNASDPKEIQAVVQALDLLQQLQSCRTTLPPTVKP
jgi:hypothetical protein